MANKDYDCHCWNDYPNENHKYYGCSDTPPENNKHVLLSFENFSFPLVGRYEEDSHGGAYYIGDDTRTCGSNGMIVNAWMNLPTPYRDEEE